MGRIGDFISSKIKDMFMIGTVESKYGHNVQGDIYSPSGDASRPIKDDKVLLIEEQGTGNYIIAGVLNKFQDAAIGEKVLYSRDGNGDLKAKIHIKNDGDIIINANKDKTIIELKNDGKLNINTDGNIDINSDAVITIDGTSIELNGNTKNFVTHTELNTALQTLISSLNSHVHTSAAPGSPTSSPTTPMTIDITAAKTNTVKTG